MSSKVSLPGKGGEALLGAVCQPCPWTAGVCKALDWLATALPAARNAGGAKGGAQPATWQLCSKRGTAWQQVAQRLALVAPIPLPSWCRTSCTMLHFVTSSAADSARIHAQESALRAVAPPPGANIAAWQQTQVMVILMAQATFSQKPLALFRLQHSAAEDKPWAALEVSYAKR